MTHAFTIIGGIWMTLTAAGAVAFAGLWLAGGVQEHRRQRRFRRMEARVMALVMDLTTPDVPPTGGGYILESRVFVPGDTDQEIIAHLTGETQ